jgi:hypothetical protein
VGVVLVISADLFDLLSPSLPVSLYIELCPI